MQEPLIDCLSVKLPTIIFCDGFNLTNSFAQEVVRLFNSGEHNIFKEFDPEIFV